MSKMSDDSSDDENVIRYGTPLEPYEEDEIPSKKRSQHGAAYQQYAVDSQGQRRFHGAFTGGFQAGHGNTVAAPEGWTPSQFKSSRKDKGSFANQKPEDFMDDEDRGEFGIAPRTVQFNKDFSSNKRPHSKHNFHDGPIPGEPVLCELMSMVHESAAVRMLCGMGWKPGQGVGERQSAADKRQRRQAVRKVYGCHVPAEYKQPATEDSDPAGNSESDECSDGDINYETLFAPDDFQLLVQKTKNDTFGLGYQGLSRRSVLGSLSGHYGEDVETSSHLVLRERGKKVSIRGQAFGVGALEEDDEDIYAREDMSNYDFVLDPKRSETKPNKIKATHNSANVLEGFIPASAAQASVSHYPPPALPRDYTPRAGVRKSRFQPDTTTQMRERNLARHELTSTQRGSMLGEATNTTTKPSGTTPTDIIASIAGGNVNFISTVETQPELSIENNLELKPNENAIEQNNEDFNTFRPFASNPEKQARYEKFLEIRKGNVLEDTERSSGRDRLMEWERVREKSEFEQAAKLYRPLTGILSDRFTRPSQPDDASTNPLVPVTRSKTHSAATQEQVDAALMGMFGKLTRTSQDWRPDALLCKRFNVPEPYGSRLSEMTNEKKNTSYSIFNYLDSSVHDKESFAKEQAQFCGSKSLNQTNNNTDKTTILKSENLIVKKDSEDKVEKNVAVINKRLTVTELFILEREKEHKKNIEDLNERTSLKLPDDEINEEVHETIDKFDKIDLYKAIFLSDSESESECDKEMSKTKSSEDTTASSALLNVERNPSPPRGIFANIDFDEINSWQKFSTESSKKTKVIEKPTSSQSIVNQSEANNKTIGKHAVSNVDVTDQMTYGPKLPDKPFLKIDKFNISNTIDLECSSSESKSWVDASDKTKKRKKKSKDKHKKHKHKHKSKHSKHKSRY